MHFVETLLGGFDRKWVCPLVLDESSSFRVVIPSKDAAATIGNGPKASPVNFILMRL